MNRRSFFSAIGAIAATAAVDPERLLWTPGKKLISIPKAGSWMEDEFQKDLAFLSGQQWPADILKERVKMGRPCLVVNRLPDIVLQKAAAHTEKTGETPTTLHLKRLISGTVREHRDIQMVLNYVASAEAERMGCEWLYA